jgi:hypothetical protein
MDAGKFPAASASQHNSRSTMNVVTYSALSICSNSSFRLSVCASSTWEANDTQNPADLQRSHAGSVLQQSIEALDRWDEVLY